MSNDRPTGKSGQSNTPEQVNPKVSQDSVVAPFSLMVSGLLPADGFGRLSADDY